MNRVARATVECHLYVQRDDAWKARDGAIEKGDTKEHIQIWDDIGKLYDELLKQVEQMDGYKLVEEYKESLLNYWGDGHGDMLVLISELQGFVDCLIRQELIKEEDYNCIIDCFREEAKKLRKR